MNRIIYAGMLTLLWCLMFPLTSKSQIQYSGPSITLPDNQYPVNPNNTTNCYVVTGRDKIILEPGFVYDPMGSTNQCTGEATKFVGQIDENMLVAPDYVTASNPTEIYNSHPINTGLAVGAIGGSGSVSPSGGATYNIPIEAIAGINGLAPQISLSYNSQGGNGIAGWGWNLSGISSFDRVPNTIYHDGFTKGIEFDADSRYALDGNRLIDVGGVYHTENETFSNITVTGDFANPTSFTVIAKNGMTYVYSHKALNNSKWLVTQITDPYNNTINFTYDTESEASPVSIDYMGNSIKFFYETRTDGNWGYINGAMVAQTKILHKIRTTAGNSTFREYELKYFKAFSDLYSRLFEIKLKGSDGSEVNSTVVDWGGTSILSTTTMINQKNPDDFEYMTGDFNGDGKTDIIEISKRSTSYVIYSQISPGYYAILSSNFFSNGNQSYYLPYFFPHLSQDNYNKRAIADFNGDGLDDIAMTFWTGSVNGIDNYQVIVFYNSKNDQSNTFFSEDKSVVVNDYPSLADRFPVDLKIGDFDGDGLVDLLLIYQTGDITQNFFRIMVKIPGEVGFWSMYSDNYTTDVLCSDYNGNGKTDITLISPGSAINGTNKINFDLQIIECNQNQQPWTKRVLVSKQEVTQSMEIIPIFGVCYIADFNGDGKTDLFIQQASTDNYKLYYSTGINQLNAIDVSLDGQNIVYPADFNNDGKADIMTAYKYSSSDVIFNFRLLNFVNGNMESFGGGYFYDCTGNFLAGDFDNDGKPDFLPIRKTANQIMSFKSFYSDDKRLFTRRIKNGMNIETSFEFDNLTNSQVYSKTNNGYISSIPTVNNYPFKTIIGPMTVAKSISMSNGIGGLNTTTFKYADLAIHLTGKGFLGFQNIKSSGELQNTESIFKPKELGTAPNKYCTLELISQNIKTSGEADMDKKTFTYEYSINGKSVLQKVETITDDHFVNGTSTTTNTYDSYGNITTQYTLYPDNNSIHTANTDITHVIYPSQIPSFPGNVVTTKSIDNDSYAITTDFTWNANGQLFKKESNGILTTNTYNSNGTLQNTTTTGAKTLTESFQYDGHGNVTKKIDPLLHETKMEYNAFGQPISTTDINKFVTTLSYDGFNRMTRKMLPDGQSVAYTTAFNGSSAFYTLEESSGSPYVKTFYDMLGRSTKVETQGFGGSLISSTVTYKATGETDTKTRPDGVATSYAYDAWGRVSSESTTGMGQTSFGYTGTRKVEATTPTGVVTKLYNCLGMVTSVTDNGGTTGYTYKGHGGVATVTGAGAGTSMEYVDGRQTSLTDPDAGTINYTYNNFGELLTQVSPGTEPSSTVTTSMQYDLAGRCTTKIIAGVTYTYAYDTDLLGSLSSVTATNGMGIIYQYNRWGDMLQKTETFAGHDYITKYDYDSKHRLTQKTYPANFAVSYSYDNLGFLSEITTTGGTSVWKATATDEMGHVTQYETNGITANNYFATNGNMSHAVAQFTTGTNEDPVTTTIQDMAFIWDNTKANLNSRLDYAKNTYEDFNYDGVQRCTTSVLKDIQTNSPISNLSMSYFDNGNISYKSNAGDFDYTGLRPHALKKVTNFPSDFPVRDQSVNYNEFNKVSSIEEDIYRMELTYGTAAERRKVVLKNKNTDAMYYTKYYAEDYEKTVFTDNHTRELYYISSPSGLVAINVRNSNSPQQDSLYLIFKDHLGSLAIITNANGTVLQRLSYDMWGKRTVTEHAVGYANSIFDRGFTGHEHLEAFNLINMNGRVFDPVLGRFLSPDNYVQGDGSQGFNRYSYCLNNPLKYTDPSGEFIGLVFGGAIIGGYIGGFKSSGEWNPFNWSTSDWQAAGIGAIMGAGVGAFVAPVVAGTTAWSVTSTALLMGNINMTFTAAAGGNRDEIFTSGLHGMATGAALGGMSAWAPKTVWGFLAKRNIANNLDWVSSFGKDDDLKLSAGIIQWNISNSVRGADFDDAVSAPFTNHMSFYESMNMLYETAGMMTYLPDTWIKPGWITNPVSFSDHNTIGGGGKSYDFRKTKEVANAVYNNSIMDHFFNENRIINSYLIPNKANYPMSSMIKEGLRSCWESINSYF